MVYYLENAKKTLCKKLSQRLAFFLKLWYDKKSSIFIYAANEISLQILGGFYHAPYYD